ncbi:hypothetical protein Hanom_Chr03g00255761 [Helianthus anomalus]
MSVGDYILIKNKVIPISLLTVAKLEIFYGGSKTYIPKNFYRTGGSKTYIPKKFLYENYIYITLLAEKIGRSGAPLAPSKHRP